MRTLLKLSVRRNTPSPGPSSFNYRPQTDRRTPPYLTYACRLTSVHEMAEHGVAAKEMTPAWAAAKLLNKTNSLPVLERAPRCSKWVTCTLCPLPCLVLGALLESCSRCFISFAWRSSSHGCFVSRACFCGSSKALRMFWSLKVAFFCTRFSSVMASCGYVERLSVSAQGPLMERTER